MGKEWSLAFSEQSDGNLTDSSSESLEYSMFSWTIRENRKDWTSAMDGGQTHQQWGKSGSYTYQAWSAMTRWIVGNLWKHTQWMECWLLSGGSKWHLVDAISALNSKYQWAQLDKSIKSPSLWHVGTALRVSRGLKSEQESLVAACVLEVTSKIQNLNSDVIWSSKVWVLTVS